MTVVALSVADRVAAGAAWLDEHRPGWADRIDLDQLDLSDCEVCVLGQIYGGYAVADDDDAEPDSRTGLRDRDAARLGFEVAGEYTNFEQHRALSEYGQLTAAWRDLIARRAGGA